MCFSTILYIGTHGFTLLAPGLYCKTRALNEGTKPGSSDLASLDWARHRDRREIRFSLPPARAPQIFLLLTHYSNSSPTQLLIYYEHNDLIFAIQ